MAERGTAANSGSAAGGEQQQQQQSFTSSPYSITLPHGFLFAFKLTPGQAVVHVLHHLRRPERTPALMEEQQQQQQHNGVGGKRAAIKAGMTAAASSSLNSNGLERRKRDGKQRERFLARLHETMPLAVPSFSTGSSNSGNNAGINAGDSLKTGGDGSTADGSSLMSVGKYAAQLQASLPFEKERISEAITPGSQPYHVFLAIDRRKGVHVWDVGALGPYFPGKSSLQLSSQVSLQQQYGTGIAKEMNTAAISDLSAYSSSNAAANSGISPSAPTLSTELSMDLDQIAYMFPYNMYVGCSHDAYIKIFNSRMETVCMMPSNRPVLCVHYNNKRDEIVSGHMGALSIWTIEATRHRRNISVSLTQRLVIDENIPKDAWITSILLDEPGNRIFVKLEYDVLVYDSASGKLLENLTDLHTRKITSILLTPFGHLVTACKDGTIRVWSATRGHLADLAGHTREVLSLANYPNKAAFISSSLDGTLRVWSLATLKETYRLRTRKPILGMGLTECGQIYYYSEGAIKIWCLNNFHSLFAEVNNPILRLSLIPRPSSHSAERAMMMTEDGSVRLLSPISGETITVAYPILNEADVVKSVVYSRYKERMFFLLNSGEILVYTTNKNPSQFLHLWQRDAAGKEDLTCIQVYDGKIRRQKNTPVRSEPDNLNAEEDEADSDDETMQSKRKLKGSESDENEYDYFAVLLGGTGNGQIVLFDGRTGMVRARIPGHSSEVTQIFSSPDDKCIVTSGKDCTLKVWHIKISEEDFLSPMVSVSLGFSPTMIAKIDNFICVVSNENAVSILDISKKDVQILQHSSDEDHSDTVTGISACQKLNLFLTSSLDGTLKVWDLRNSLVRDILFNEPIPSVCFADSKGSILVAIQNQIDYMKPVDYLPSSYIRALLSSKWIENVVLEQPAPFDIDSNPHENLQRNLQKMHNKKTIDIREHHRENINLIELGIFGPELHEDECDKSKKAPMTPDFAAIFANESFLGKASETSSPNTKTISISSDKTLLARNAAKNIISKRVLRERAKSIVEAREMDQFRRFRAFEEEELRLSRYRHPEESYQDEDEIVVHEFSMNYEALETEEETEWTEGESDLIASALIMDIGASIPNLTQDNSNPDQGELDLSLLESDPSSTSPPSGDRVSDLNQAELNSVQIKDASESNESDNSEAKSDIKQQQGQQMETSDLQSDNKDNAGEDRNKSDNESDEDYEEIELLMNEVKKKNDQLISVLPRAILAAVQRSLDPHHPNVAPDGVVPNSIVHETIRAWLHRHETFEIKDLSVNTRDIIKLRRRRERRKKRDALNLSRFRKITADEFETKMRKFMSQLDEAAAKERDEAAAAAEKERLAAEKAAAEAAEKVAVEEEMKREEERRLQAFNQRKMSRKQPPPRAKTPPHEAQRRFEAERPKTPVPPIFERLLGLDWFKQEWIVTLERDNRNPSILHKKFLIEPTMDKTASLLLKIFKNPETTLALRMKIRDCISIMRRDFPFTDLKEVIREYCGYLQQNFMSTHSDDETALRVGIIDNLSGYMLAKSEIVTTLLLQLCAPSTDIKNAAISGLNFLGIQQENSVQLQKRIEFAAAKIKHEYKSKLNEDEAERMSQQVRKEILDWLKQVILAFKNNSDAAHKLLEIPAKLANPPAHNETTDSSPHGDKKSAHGGHVRISNKVEVLGPSSSKNASHGNKSRAGTAARKGSILSDSHKSEENHEHEHQKEHSELGNRKEHADVEHEHEHEHEHQKEDSGTGKEGESSSSPTEVKINDHDQSNNGAVNRTHHGRANTAGYDASSSPPKHSRMRGTGAASASPSLLHSADHEKSKHLGDNDLPGSASLSENNGSTHSSVAANLGKVEEADSSEMETTEEDAMRGGSEASSRPITAATSLEMMYGLSNASLFSSQADVLNAIHHLTSKTPEPELSSPAPPPEETEPVLKLPRPILELPRLFDKNMSLARAGITHKSHCHPERETASLFLPNLVHYKGGTTHSHPFWLSPKRTKELPVEKVKLDLFAETPRPVPRNGGVGGRPGRRHEASMPSPPPYEEHRAAGMSFQIYRNDDAIPGVPFQSELSASPASWDRKISSKKYYIPDQSTYER